LPACGQHYQGECREKDLSTVRDQEEAGSWLSGPYVNRGRTKCDSEAAAEGPQTPLSLDGLCTAIAQSGVRKSDGSVVPGRQGFPRTERLTRKREYERVYQEGARRVSDAFICFAVRRAGQGRKIGCAVSRKVGSAVVRNRVKRYIREVYRTHRGEIVDDVHFVVVAKPVSAMLGFHECERTLRRLFQKGDMLDG